MVQEYYKIKELLKKEPDKHNKMYINRLLHEKENIRKVFLAIVKKEPARIGDVFEDTYLTRPTCYSQLYKLLDLKLVKRIFVIDVINNDDNTEIKEKFTGWTKNMPPQLKRYYLAKTSYWSVSDFGKKFAEIAYNFEQEFRKKVENE